MIHKRGYEWGTPYDEAIAEATEHVKNTPQDTDPIWETGIFWTKETEGKQFFVKIVTRID